MNQSLLFISAFASGFAGLGCLCMAMTRYARQIASQLMLTPWRRILQLTGWSLILLTTTILAVTQGWGFGLVWIAGISSFTAPLLILMLSYHPRWIVGSSVTSSAIGLLGFCWITLTHY